MTEVGAAEPSRPPARPSANASTRPALLLALAWLCGFTFSFDSGVVSLALPDIADDLDRSIADLAWVVTAYLLPLAAFLVAAGKLGERYGTRLVLTGGALLFLVSTLVAGVAPTFEVLVIARAVQGLAGAVLYTLSLALAATAYGPARRATAISIYFTSGALGAVIGPAAGGLITAVGGWRLVFLAQLPLAALLALLTVVLLRSGDRRVTAFDAIGVALASLFLLAANYALLEAPTAGWASVPVIGGVAVAALSLALFVLRERSTPDPAIPLGIFRNRRFAVGSLIGAAAWFGIMSGSVYPAVYLQLGRGFDPASAGLLLLAPPLAALLLFPFTGRVVARLGPERGMLIGSLVSVLGAVGMVLYRGDTPPWFVLLVGAVTGLGIALMLVASAADALAQFPPERVATGSAIFNSVRQLGAALGVAIPAVAFSFVAGTDRSSAAALAGSTAAFVVRTVVLVVPLVLLLVASPRVRASSGRVTSSANG